MPSTNAENCKRYRERLKKERPEDYKKMLRRINNWKNANPHAKKAKLESIKRWKKNNPEKVKAQRKRYNDRIRKNKPTKILKNDEKWALVHKYKMSGCNRCSEGRFACLEFHHIEPKNKLFQIAYGVRNKSIKLLQAEIDKCEVLCSNCHKLHHYSGV